MKTLIIFLSETTRHRALISSSRPEPRLFKLCPWGQKGPTPGVTCFTQVYIGKHEKSACLKTQGRER